MTTLYEIREQLKALYGKYDLYINTLLKFVLGLICFFLINSRLGYMKVLDNFAVPVLLSLLCSFLPINCMVVFAVVIVLIHFFALSLELAGVAAALLLVMLFLYFIMAPRHGYMLILTPLLFVIKIPYAVPVIVGLIGGPICAVPVACGVVSYYIMHFAVANADIFTNADSASMGDMVKYTIEYMIGNKEMMLTVVAFAIVLCIVYILRRTSMDYAWYIAIGAGALANILIFLIGDFAMDISNSIPGLLLGTVGAVLVSFVVQFFVFSVDYSGTRKVQFEDDEYYYYVKAVPKITISAKNKQVKEIHARTRRSPREGQGPRRAPAQRRAAHPQERGERE